jgi:hypothetical protein
MTFKITNILKVNNNNLKFNGNFKIHITVEIILEKTPNIFNKYIYIYIYIYIYLRLFFFFVSNFPEYVG